MLAAKQAAALDIATFLGLSDGQQLDVLYEVARRSPPHAAALLFAVSGEASPLLAEWAARNSRIWGAWALASLEEISPSVVLTSLRCVDELKPGRAFGE
jgi:hypothetical protein